MAEYHAFSDISNITISAGDHIGFKDKHYSSIVLYVNDITSNTINVSPSIQTKTTPTQLRKYNLDQYITVLV